MALWKRVQSTRNNSAVTAGFANDPVHVPPGQADFEVCPAGSVCVLMSINVAPSSGGVTVTLGSGPTANNIVSLAVLARDYKMGFYCPVPLYCNTPGQGEDVTFYVAPTPKGYTVA